MKKSVAFVIVIAASAFPLAPVSAATPAFDCAKASYPDEKAICHSPDLANLDSKLYGLYHDIKACSGMQGQGIQEDQNEWLKSRRACGADQACLEKLYTQRIAKLTPDAAKSRKAQKTQDCPIF